MQIIECHYDPPHVHEYPDDWMFGGANGLHPAGDPRYRPTTYIYYDHRFEMVHLTQEFLCDDEALDKFTKVAQYCDPYVVEAKRPDGTKEMLPFTYSKSEDTVRPLASI